MSSGGRSSLRAPRCRGPASARPLRSSRPAPLSPLTTSPNGCPRRPRRSRCSIRLRTGARVRRGPCRSRAVERPRSRPAYHRLDRHPWAIGSGRHLPRIQDSGDGSPGDIAGTGCRKGRRRFSPRSRERARRSGRDALLTRLVERPPGDRVLIGSRSPASWRGGGIAGATRSRPLGPRGQCGCAPSPPIVAKLDRAAG